MVVVSATVVVVSGAPVVVVSGSVLVVVVACVVGAAVVAVLTTDGSVEADLSSLLQAASNVAAATATAAMHRRVGWWDIVRSALGVGGPLAGSIVIAGTRWRGCTPSG